MDYVERLTGLREDHDLDQADVAKLLNVQQSAISKYETHKAKYKIEDIIKLCEFYNVSADYLLGLPKGMPYPNR